MNLKVLCFLFSIISSYASFYKVTALRDANIVDMDSFDVCTIKKGESVYTPHPPYLRRVGIGYIYDLGSNIDDFYCRNILNAAVKPYDFEIHLKVDWAYPGNISFPGQISYPDGVSYPNKISYPRNRNWPRNTLEKVKDILFN